MYYQQFYLKNIADGQYTKKPWDLCFHFNKCHFSKACYSFFLSLLIFSCSWREEMAKIYQIASVLYDVLRTVVPADRIDNEVWFVHSWLFTTKFWRHALCQIYSKGLLLSYSVIPDSEICWTSWEEKGAIWTL